jgi:hypothetical protein
MISLFSSPLINRLGTMGLKWKDIPDKITGKIEHGLLKNVGRFNHVSFTALLKACGLLDYQWTGKPQTSEVIFQSWSTVFSDETGNNSDGGRGLSNCVYYLGKTGIRWTELPSEVQGIIMCESSRLTSLLSHFQRKSLLEG